MKRKKDWRKYLEAWEKSNLSIYEDARDSADTEAFEARQEIRKIMTRCWSRMKRDK